MALGASAVYHSTRVGSTLLLVLLWEPARITEIRAVGVGVVAPLTQNVVVVIEAARLVAEGVVASELEDFVVLPVAGAAPEPPAVDFVDELLIDGFEPLLVLSSLGGLALDERLAAHEAFGLGPVHGHLRRPAAIALVRGAKAGSLKFVSIQKVRHLEQS